MKEFESCDKCKYHNRSQEELPCVKCTHNGCKDFYSPKTNGDRIRSMSDEELAKWIHNITQLENPEDEEPMVSIYDIYSKKDIVIHDSYGDLLKWLQEPVEE